MHKTKVLFVCMGNICRSPTAEGVFRDKIKKTAPNLAIEIDSAGTHDYHIGKAPDARAQVAAQTRGYDISDLRGRQVNPHDFEKFDYVLAMDKDNLTILQKMCPAHLQHKVKRLLAFSHRYPNLDVPDPYYGGQSGFSQVLDMIEDATDGLLDDIKQTSSKLQTR